MFFCGDVSVGTHGVQCQVYYSIVVIYVMPSNPFESCPAGPFSDVQAVQCEKCEMTRDPVNTVVAVTVASPFSFRFHSDFWR